MRSGYALKGEWAVDLKVEIEGEVTQDYTDTDPEDATTGDKLETIDDLLVDPAVKTALLEWNEDS